MPNAKGYLLGFRSLVETNHKQRVAFDRRQLSLQGMRPEIKDGELMKHQPTDFLDTQGVKFSPNGDCCWDSLPVLQFLLQHPWDEIALAYVTALRPSRIRVSYGPVTCDSMPWRVTVILDRDSKLIRSIDQEVEIEPPSPMSGYDLEKLAQARGIKIE